MLVPLVALVLSAAAPAVSADVLKSADEARDLTDRVMTRLAASDLDGAFRLVRPYFIVSKAEFETMLGLAKLQLPMASQRFGKALLLEFPGVFFWLVAPANEVFLTAGPASIPANWMEMRASWETGHALRFVLQFVALAALVKSLASSEPK